MAAVLENMDKVEACVKNQGPGFTIPCTLNGEEQHDYPDFLARVRRSGGPVLNLIVEVSGEARKDKAAKAATARALGPCGEQPRRTRTMGVCRGRRPQGRRARDPGDG